MSIVCSCGSHRVKLMWDVHGTGLWCAGCGASLRPSDLPVPDELADRVRSWNRRCASLGRQEMFERRPVPPEEWQALEEEARRLRLELDRHVRTYLYRPVRGLPPDGAPVCPDCGRPLTMVRAQGGYRSGICEECLYWVVYREPGGRPARPSG